VLDKERKTPSIIAPCEQELSPLSVRCLVIDSYSYLLAMVIPAAVGLVSIMIFTRIFPPDSYGFYALTMAAIGVTGTVLSQWIQQSVLRYLPEFRTNQRTAEFMHTWLVVVLTITSVASIILVASFPFLKPFLGNHYRFYVYGGFLLLASVLFGNFGTIFQANLQPRKYAMYQILSSIGQLTFALIFVFLIARDTAVLILGGALAYGILIVPMIRDLGMLGQRGKPLRGFNRKLVRKFVRYGGPMIFWFLGSQILSMSDRFIIGALKGPVHVGIYVSNYALVRQAVGLVAGPLLMAAHPLIVNAWENGSKDAIQGIVSGFSRYYLMIVVPFAACVAILSYEIATLLLGEAYREGHVIMPIVLPGFLAWNLAMYGHKGLELMERTRVIALLVTICAALNIGLNFLIVPFAGYVGAAATTSISYILYPVLVYLVARRRMRWQIPWRSLRNIGAATLAVSGILVSMKWFFAGKIPIIVLILVAGLVSLPAYCIVLVLMGEFEDHEIASAKSLVMKLLGR